MRPFASIGAAVWATRYHPIPIIKSPARFRAPRRCSASDSPAMSPPRVRGPCSCQPMLACRSRCSSTLGPGALSRDSAGSITARDQDSGAHTADYYEAFGYLDYATPVASGSGAITGADLGLPGDYYVLDERSRAVPLPAALIEVATCALNATLHPDAAMLLRTLPLRVPALLDAGSDRLEPIVDDDELRAFAEEYVREELAGFVCPTDREAWESRWLQSFERLYAPRNAEQRTRLERALDGLLAWVYGPESYS